MARKLTRLRQLDIPIPCTETWEHMEGDQKRRFCAGCGCHVHNVAELKAQEAEKLLAGSERVCTRILTDPIRGVLTKDGWVARMLVAGAAVAAFAGGLPELAAAGQDPSPTAHAGEVTTGKPAPRPQALLGEVVAVPPTHTLGRLAKAPIPQSGQANPDCTAPEVTHYHIGKVRVVKAAPKTRRQSRAKHHASKHK